MSPLVPPGPPPAAGEALRIAAQLDVQAEAVASVATRSALIAERLLWRSRGATGFRHQVLARAAALRAAAAGLQDAAEQLRSYATAVAPPEPMPVLGRVPRSRER